MYVPNKIKGGEKKSERRCTLRGYVYPNASLLVSSVWQNSIWGSGTDQDTLADVIVGILFCFVLFLRLRNSLTLVLWIVLRTKKDNRKSAELALETVQFCHFVWFAVGICSEYSMSWSFFYPKRVRALEMLVLSKEGEWGVELCPQEQCFLGQLILFCLKNTDSVCIFEELFAAW